MTPEMSDSPATLAPPPEAQEPAAPGETITVVCLPDGTYTVNGEAFDDLEDALRKIVQLCQDGQGESTKEDDYQAGFGKSDQLEERESQS